MCGIVGFTGRSGTEARATARRDGGGPGAPRPGRVRGLDHGRALALGHARLAIIDLSPDALQPFHRAPGPAGGAGGRVIVFNGEIYNYLELRAELMAAGLRLPHQLRHRGAAGRLDAWGPDCLPRLRGMYAFAVWDPEAATLHLARDPFGKKPLLYFRAGDELVFASELEALAVHPAFDPAIDPAALGQYPL